MRNRFAILIASIVALSAVAVVAQGQGNRVAVSIPASSEILASCAGGIIYVTPEGAARVVGCSNPATATATVPPTASITPGPTNTAGPSSTPTITPTPDAQWWLAGGVDPADVVGAWRAKGAASWPASLVNLNGGAALHAPQSQPTWTAANGWQGGQGAEEPGGGLIRQHRIADSMAQSGREGRTQMASIVEQLAGELGVSSELVRAALGGGEVQALRSKRAVIQGEWATATAAHEAQIGEIDALIADAQKRLDEAAGKG